MRSLGHTPERSTRKPTAVSRLSEKVPQTRWTEASELHRPGATHATTHADADCRNLEYRGTGSANATARILALVTGWGSGCFDYDCSEAADVTLGVGDKYLHFYYLTGFGRVKENR